MRWDNASVGRDEALALFHASASPAQSLHANSGGHGIVPLFERASRENVFVRQLGRQ